MFFKLVARNSRRSRKENGLFFASLIISTVAFYIILSLSHQDVMVFLAKMESDAVNKLLAMIPVFYGLTLFILFFLIYYASKFQVERRRHEFGVYLMMGMRRSKLFAMLLAEDFRSSIIALVIGLPVAVLLSELISLVTARFVGLGIIGHRVTFSLQAVLYTAVGFLLIKLAAFLILSGRIARQEIGSLLVETPEGTKRQYPACIYVLALFSGTAGLAVAYSMAISGLSWHSIGRMGLTVVLGLLGTLLLFFGLRSVVGFLAEHGKQNRRLQVFNFRQLQENVIHRSGTLGISSLLILAALCCFGAGVGIARFYSGSEQHVLDYTFTGEELDKEKVQEALAASELESGFSELFEIRVGHISTTEDYEHAFQMDSVMSAISELPETQDREVLLNNLGYDTFPYLLSLSDYNQLLKSAGMPALTLAEDEALVYMDSEFTTQARLELLDRVLEKRPKVQLDGKTCKLAGSVQTVDIVTDRSITLSFALILPDKAFAYYTQGNSDVYVNGVLSAEATGEAGLMAAISEMNEKLNETGLAYESYLQNMGRQLFYVVAASYITIYLALIFLIIANTVIGVQFLMGQQKSGRRYKTLIRLGATYEMLCKSAKKQINWYFGIPTVVAGISSLFGARALFTGLLPGRVQSNLTEMMWVSAAMILILCVIEYIYMAAVKHSSSRYLLTLMVPEREE